MSLKETHPIWEMAENGYEVEKALTVCTMLSGRYATDYHARHWSQVNTKCYCQLCLAASHSEDSQSKPDDEIPLGSLEHLLLDCPALNQTRNTSKKMWASYVADKPALKILIPIDSEEFASWEPSMEFLLDPTSHPATIRVSQTHGVGIFSSLLYLTRTWCHSIHTRRRKLLKLLNIF